MIPYRGSVRRYGLEARKSRDKLKARLLTTLVGDCAKVGYTVDDVTTENAELKILMGFLPSQLDDDQLNTVIEELIFSSGCYKIGVVMKMLKQGYDGTYDPRRASAIAKDLIETLGV